MQSLVKHFWCYFTVRCFFKVASTIADKIFGVKERNSVKLEKTRKV